MGFGGQFGYYKDYTGYYLLGHRYYDPGTGKFINRDPIGYKGGINLYGFAGNNPVNESDPDGYAPPGATMVRPPSLPRGPLSEPVGEQPVRVIGRGAGRLLFRYFLIANLALHAYPLADDSTGPSSPYAVKMAAEERKRDRKGKFVPDPDRTKSPAFDPRVARRAWEKKNNRPWPKDPLTDENFDVQHMKKRSQGGALYDPDNIFPIHKQKHDRYHAKSGPDPN